MPVLMGWIFSSISPLSFLLSDVISYINTGTFLPLELKERFSIGAFYSAHPTLCKFWIQGIPQDRDSDLALKSELCQTMKIPLRFHDLHSFVKEGMSSLPTVPMPLIVLNKCLWKYVIKQGSIFQLFSDENRDKLMKLEIHFIPSFDTNSSVIKAIFNT